MLLVSRSYRPRKLKVLFVVVQKPVRATAPFPTLSIQKLHVTQVRKNHGSTAWLDNFNWTKLARNVHKGMAELVKLEGVEAHGLDAFRAVCIEEVDKINVRTLVHITKDRVLAVGGLARAPFTRSGSHYQARCVRWLLLGKNHFGKAFMI